MNESLSSPKDLELDLSFHGVSDHLLKDLSDQSIRKELTEIAFWQKDLSNWIQYVRSNQTLLCPEIVRSVQVLTMGLQFTDDSTITTLNSTWRKKYETTDVLTFSVLDENMINPNNQSLELGDIIVSVVTAEKQAKEHNHTFLRELRWLVSHGLLHLLGWDHSTAKELKEMLSCQEQLLDIKGTLLSNGDQNLIER